MFAPKTRAWGIPIAPQESKGMMGGGVRARRVGWVWGEGLIRNWGEGEVMGKAGVGKTTVSRTLLDYFSANNVPTRAFDTESPRGTLKRFHPDFTEIVDMTTTSDQMKIFDTLNSSGPSVTVIDVRAGLLSPALAALRA